MPHLLLVLHEKAFHINSGNPQPSFPPAAADLGPSFRSPCREKPSSEGEPFVPVSFGFLSFEPTNLTWLQSGGSQLPAHRPAVMLRVP